MPLQLMLLSVPSIVYIAVLRRRGKEWSEVLGKIGWQGCTPHYFLVALGVSALLGGLGWLTFQYFVPQDVLQEPNANISEYAGWTLGVTSFLLAWWREAIYTALGEEVFFRGFLGGWLIRRFGFAIGNTVQALIFLVPHLFLLTININFYPIIPVQLLAGWLFGWLRYRSNSILPGWLAHSLVNALGALAAMT